MEKKLSHCEAQKRYKQRNPWAKTMTRIRQRCNHPTGRQARYYDPSMINITLDELKELWFRDEAYLMDVPSIDRIDPSKGYSKDNCRYIEWKENMAISNNTTKRKVNQYGRDGEYLRTYGSIAEATKAVGGKSTGNICSCCRGKNATAWGFKWKYANGGIYEN